VLAAGLVASCNAGDGPEPDPAPEAATTTAATAPSRHPSPLRATGEAAALASDLDRAVATLHETKSAVVEVRQAAELHQLAVRRLASASATFRRQVLARLRPRTAAMVRGDLRAARSLGSLTAPQPRLPDWRIVAPPPASQLTGHYREAQRRTGVPWSYLAAIHLVETRMGRIRGTSSAGARGPMQFLPATWELYGAGGDINDPRDAILAAARLLEANGAPADMAHAVWHYNPSDRYVRAVTEYARNIQRSAAAYRSYWHWRVLYRHTRGTHLLPVGYPDEPAVLLPAP
jgi:membrane-bound lytic murein transglycosylase B